ncbi:MAG: hypothetical protein AB1647_15315 [Pseudomonadota bacterium]|jgi:hypothetical protein
MKKIISALCLAVAVSVAPAFMVVPHAVAQEASALQTMEADIEALLIANADDPDAFAAAVEQYLLAAADPELAAEAVISVLTNPKSEAAQIALANNPALKTAGGQGLGAAIAQIGLTNPTVAANIQAKVEASNDATLQAAVTQGTTATIQRQQQQQQQQWQQQRDSTPETPVSPN